MNDQPSPDDTLPDDACLDTLVDVAVLQFEFTNTEAEVGVPVLAPKEPSEEEPSDESG